MRGILFRGKRLDNDEWETGSLVIIRGGCSDESVYIADKMTGYLTPIHADSRGQYTGLEDKNGKKIFKGDIVKLFVPRDNREPLVHKGKIIWWECGFAICYDDKVFGKDKITCLPYGKFIEVIGNIHDNPELLQSE